MLIEDPRRARFLALVEPCERSAVVNRFLEPLLYGSTAFRPTPAQLLAQVHARNARRDNGTPALIDRHPFEAESFAAWALEWHALDWKERDRQQRSGRGARAIARREA